MITLLALCLGCSEQNFVAHGEDDEIAGISVAPGDLYFHGVPVGETATRTFQVSNTGETTHTLESIALSGGEGTFSLLEPQMPFELGSDEVVTATVAFEPHDLVAYQGLGQVEATTGPAGNVNLVGHGTLEETTWPPAEDDPCGGLPTQQTTVTVTFEEPTTGCPFGVDDNQESDQGYAMARIEQVVPLEFPSQLCDVDLGFSTQTQQLQYDDAFIINLNDIVLVATSHSLIENLPWDGTTYRYDWSSLVGNTLDWSSVHYCIGEEAGFAACEIPASDVSGDIDLSFGSEVSQLLVDRINLDDDLELSMVTVGDNDLEDCWHTPLSFEVTLRWTEE